VTAMHRLLVLILLVPSAALAGEGGWSINCIQPKDAGAIFHESHADPIMCFGMQGGSDDPRHLFAGPLSTNNFTSVGGKNGPFPYNDLDRRAPTCGQVSVKDSSISPEDHSAYWASKFHTADGGSFGIRSITAYYKSGGVRGKLIPGVIADGGYSPYPHGLQMVVGVNRRVGLPYAKYKNGSRNPNGVFDPDKRNRITWTCHGNGSNEGAKYTDGGIVRDHGEPLDCSDAYTEKFGGGVDTGHPSMQVKFPTCWDGDTRNLVYIDPYLNSNLDTQGDGGVYVTNMRYFTDYDEEGLEDSGACGDPKGELDAYGNVAVSRTGVWVRLQGLGVTFVYGDPDDDEAGRDGTGGWLSSDKLKNSGEVDPRYLARSGVGEVMIAWSLDAGQSGLDPLADGVRSCLNSVDGGDFQRKCGDVTDKNRLGDK
jgi:hypothetical protein